MSDTRTRLEKLQDMARQDESPAERDIARDKLLAMGEGWDEPPRRPPTAAAPAPQPQWWSNSGTTTATSNANGSVWSTTTFWFSYTVGTE